MEWNNRKNWTHVYIPSRSAIVSCSALVQYGKTPKVDACAQVLALESAATATP